MLLAWILALGALTTECFFVAFWYGLRRWLFVFVDQICVSHKAQF